MFGEKIARKGKGKGGREPVDEQLSCRSSVSKIVICQSILRVGKLKGNEQGFAPSPSGRTINTVLVFGVARNKTLLVDSGQDSVVLAQAFESLRFPFEQGKSFSDLSCLTCAQQTVRLAGSVSNLTSPCSERTWSVKGTDAIMTSPEREAPKTSTKRSTALQLPTGIAPSGIYR